MHCHLLGKVLDSYTNLAQKWNKTEAA